MTSPCLPICISFCLTLNGEGDAHAAAYAQRCKPPLGVALLHFVKQRDQDAAARGADRMAEGDGAAIDVDLARVPTHLAVHSYSLRGERFVDLHQIQVLRLPSGARERAL